MRPVPWLLAWAGLCYGLFLAAGTPAALVLPRVLFSSWMAVTWLV